MQRCSIRRISGRVHNDLHIGMVIPRRYTDIAANGIVRSTFVGDGTIDVTLASIKLRMKSRETNTTLYGGHCVLVVKVFDANEVWYVFC